MEDEKVMAAYREMMDWGLHTLMPAIRKNVHEKLKEVSKKHDVAPYEVTHLLKKYPFTEVYTWLANFLYYVIHCR
jgi:hypothetical protein